MTAVTRRNFLKSAGYGSSLMTFGLAAPQIFCQAAAAARDRERILVVVEMAGGNDGLNSVIPHSDPVYRKARPELGLAARDTLGVADGIGLHPALRGLADLLEQGHFAAVQGVGYENPNRSHFESMDIWHTCQRKDATRSDGWLGRYLETDAENSSADPSAMHLGAEPQPFALMSREVRVPSIQSLQGFRLRGAERPGFRGALRDLAADSGEDELLGFVQTSTQSALQTSQRMAAAGIDDQPAAAYPQTGLGKKLETVSKLIAAEMKTRVYYIRLDGFDTHANQPAAHEALLREVGDSVQAFVNDRIAQGDGERVLVMCFSEFGRRVAENASGGTDHGTASCMFLAGTQIRPGLIGEHPSLEDLDAGDLKHHIDFRQVYASVLEQWMRVPSEQILLGDFSTLPLFA